MIPEAFKQYILCERLLGICHNEDFLAHLKAFTKDKL